MPRTPNAPAALSESVKEPASLYPSAREEHDDQHGDHAERHDEKAQPQVHAAASRFGMGLLILPIGADR